MAKVSNIAHLKANFKGFPMVHVGHFYFEVMLTKIKMASKMATNFYKLEIWVLYLSQTCHQSFPLYEIGSFEQLIVW